MPRGLLPCPVSRYNGADAGPGERQEVAGRRRPVEDRCPLSEKPASARDGPTRSRRSPSRSRRKYLESCRGPPRRLLSGSTGQKRCSYRIKFVRSFPLDPVPRLAEQVEIAIGHAAPQRFAPARTIYFVFNSPQHQSGDLAVLETWVASEV